MIAVVEKAIPEERISDSKNKIYIERYIVHESLRGNLVSGSITEAIAPNSSLRTFLERKDIMSVSIIEDGFIYEEESNKTCPSNRDIVFFVETHTPNLYDYVFKGLKIKPAINHL